MDIKSEKEICNDKDDETSYTSNPTQWFHSFFMFTQSTLHFTCFLIRDQCCAQDFIEFRWIVFAIFSTCLVNAQNQYKSKIKGEATVSNRNHNHNHNHSYSHVLLTQPLCFYAGSLPMLGRQCFRTIQPPRRNHATILALLADWIWHH